MSNSPAGLYGGEYHMPMVEANVPRFLKHRVGHTVYQVDVRMPLTRQVWSVFRRNRDFIALRQQLKAMCQQTPQQHRTITTPRNTSAKRTFTAAVGATSADHGKATAAAVTEVAVASATASTAAGSTLKKPPTLKGRTVDVEAVRAVLAGFKFPSKIAIAGPAALKMERRKAFNTFLRALVQIQPLPQSVAVFLDLLHDNRLILDHRGNYVQVMHADNVLPIPESPRHKRKQAYLTQKTSNAANPGDESSASPAAEINTDTNTGPLPQLLQPPAAVAGVAVPTAGSAISEEDGRVVGSHNARVLTSQEVPPGRHPGVRTRAWERVSAGEIAAGSGRGGSGAEARTWSSDTDEPTDCDSDAESDNDQFYIINNYSGGGHDRSGQPAGGEDDSNVRSGKSNDDAVVVDRQETMVDSPVIVSGDRNDGGDDNNSADVDRGLPEDRHAKIASSAATVITATRPITAPTTVTTTTTRNPRNLLAAEAVGRLRGGGAFGRLKGGGGNNSQDGGDEVDDEEQGWSIVRSEDVPLQESTASREAGHERQGESGDGQRDGEEGASGGGNGGVEELGAKVVDAEQEERMIQWEFENGYLEQVVSVVVRRQDLDDGIDAAERKKMLPLSEEDRNLRMAELRSLNVDLPKDQLLMLLRYNDWGPQAATTMYQNLTSAGKGSLEKTNPGGPVRGMENGGNTCYIDSLLFAMYATLDAFDWLLLKPLPTKDPPQVRLLQKHLRFLVNQLRQGAVIPREHSNLIRQHLRICGWQGGSSSQEDVSELFTFLVTLLRCPALPLSEALFHGGKSEDSDSKISTERALYLALPEREEPVFFCAERKTSPRKQTSLSSAPGGASAGSTPAGFAASAAVASSDSASPPKPRPPPSNNSGGTGAGPRRVVTLEQILMHNFHDNRVEGLRRSVSGEKGSQPVDAWRVVSMLPFYALSGEHVDDSDPSNDLHFDKVMLPMVLKRYETEESRSPLAKAHAAAGPKKSRREVVVPLRLDCSKFMTPESGGNEKSVVDQGRFILLLRSAVCHLGGDTISKGHYVAYTADRHPIEDEGGGPSLKEAAIDGRGGSSSKRKGASKRMGTTGGDGGGSLEDSVAWLRLDDLKRARAGRGFVEKIESVQDTNRVFSEDLGLHSYMLLYELIALDLNDVSKAQLEETCRLIETQNDYEIAQQMQMQQNFSHREWGGRGLSSDLCSIS